MPTKEELLHEAEWRACKRSAAHFIEHYVHISHPRGRRLFALRDSQRESLQAFEEHDRVLVLKARQIGYTTLLGAYMLWLVFFHDDQEVVALSKDQREARRLLKMAKYGYKYLPAWMKDRGPKLLTDHLDKMPFENDSTVESLPSKEDPARGRTVNLIVVDEWASLPNPEDAWASIQPTADIGGRVIAMSTAKGAGNFFHEMWNGARNGTNRFYPLFFAYDSVPERGDTWYDRTREELMVDWRMWQEYPRNEEEAFIKSGNAVFDIDLLLKLETRDAEKRGYLNQLTTFSNSEFRESPSGELEVWQPPRPGNGYAIGADVAEGLEHGDYSSAHVIERRTGLVVAHYHAHIAPDLYAEELAKLGYWYNNALIGPEANIYEVCNHLRRIGYPRIYIQRTIDDRTKRVTSKMGWHTSRRTKQLLVDELARALREQDITLLSKETVAEMLTFVRDEQGRMNGSPFDDRVISLAIAYQMVNHTSSPQQAAPMGPEEWTLDWWAGTLDENKQDPGRIGQWNVRRPL